jgi:FK506-binding protein 2
MIDCLILADFAGLLNMCEGERRKIVIPSGKGYGDRGSPPKIPGGATLVFDVELMNFA